jgi:GntR family transcriptional regulator/MocR family aminotransferase
MWLKLDGQGPAYRQIYRAIRARITSGELRPGTKLPPTRELASNLGLSRTTVLQAYDQLTAEGFITGRTGSGSYIEAPLDATPRRDSRQSLARNRDASPTLSAFGDSLARRRSRPFFGSYVSERPTLRYDFRYGRPSIVDFPVRAWQRCLGRRARAATVRDHDYNHPRGSAALRAALAEYLGRARGVVTDPAHIVVVTGSQQALDLSARVFIDAGDVVVVEDPGYEGARRAFEAAGAELAFVPVDEQGLDTDRLPGLARRAKLAHVTPSHQYPLGGVMPYPRRRALLDWAETAGAHVIEDDYDGEYRFEGRPLEALKALDGSERVLYLGTFSKVMFPALRIGYIVLPEALVEVFTRAKALTDGGGPVLEQDALADFIASGEFERHIRRSRTRYAERRATLLAALMSQLGDRVEVFGADAGLHVVVQLKAKLGIPMRELVARAAEVGVGLYPADGYYSRPPRAPTLVLGYTSLVPADLREGVKRLARLLETIPASP